MRVKSFFCWGKVKRENVKAQMSENSYHNLFIGLVIPVRMGALHQHAPRIPNHMTLIEQPTTYMLSPNVPAVPFRPNLLFLFSAPPPHFNFYTPAFFSPSHACQVYLAFYFSLAFHLLYFITHYHSHIYFMSFIFTRMDLECILGLM